MGYIGKTPTPQPLTATDIPDLPATKITSGTFPALNGSNLTNISAGKVLQVLQAVKTDTTATNSTSFADLTGMTQAITPSATSSKILCMFDGNFGAYTTSGNGQAVDFKLLRGSTAIHTPVENDESNPLEPYGENLFNHFTRMTLTKLDSPATTSSVTYKTQGRPHKSDHSGVVIFQTTGTNYSQDGTSYITLLEVAA